jgi:hypothetical protein
MADAQQTTIRPDKQMIRLLAIHKVATGESANALVLRLLDEYFAGEGSKKLAAAGFEGGFLLAAHDHLTAKNAEENQ